ncbi:MULTISPECIES: MFS transporter [unclassified Microbacterium]|uniref:MFS transporter n=1 Tax=unclassified Microbacterium TaxID=2609290 RepID=UPI0012FC37AF|nr:MFS transporter [Microbacterium sp. MAH-37]MVQ42180.1 MFS transporter [Microbacterium sp. MAH-37]
MTTSAEPSGAARAIALGAALLVGVNLRPAITSVSTLLDHISTTFALGDTGTGILATLPIVVFGVSAPLGPLLARRIGTSRALLAAMVVLAVALALRVVDGWMLVPGTFLAGAAIMVGATLIPPFLKSLNASGLWVGLSTMSFGVGAALGAGLSVPLERALGGTAQALASWAVLAVLAAAVLLLVGRGADVAAQGRPRITIASDNRLTVVIMTAVFSLQSLLYFAVTTWLPSMLAERGTDPATTGWLLGWFSLIGLIPSLVAPVIARRRRALTWFGPGLGVAMAAGYAWFALSTGTDAAVVSWLGIVQNAGFGLAIGLLVSLAADAPSAGILSAIAQGVGYAVAGVGSLLLGLLHDATGGWTASILVMAILGIALSACTALVIRRRPVSLIAG